MGLAPRTFELLPLGSVLPEGWLLDQLRVQANGLTGHLEEFWPDLGPRNMWLGGDGGDTPQGSWERAPYYLDGLVPLAQLLDDDPLKARAARWIEGMLALCDEDGWLGPVQVEGLRAYDQWPATIAAKVLLQHYSATADKRAVDVLLRLARWLQDHLDEHPLTDWGKFRWQDLSLCLQELYETTGEAWLLDVGARVAAQGYDWCAHFDDFAYTQKATEWIFENHVVNNAMGVKAGAVRWRQTSDERDRTNPARALGTLDRWHGQASGVFSGDESLAGLAPTQGTELCAVAELMFSLEHVLSIVGDPAIGDRLESVAYNAFPATFTSDMWAHQYDQQHNQVLCSVAPRAWTNNQDASNTFGLEPNYGCCTANMHQGWPKFVANMWMRPRAGGLAAAVLGPSRATAGGMTVVQSTRYPFGGEIAFRIERAPDGEAPLMMRIPAWAEGATVDGGAVRPGAWTTVTRAWRDGDIVELDLPMPVRTSGRPSGGVSLYRGPLLLALRIGEEFRPLPSASPGGDWEVHPTTPWNYALVRGTTFSVQEHDIDRVPFASNHPPVVVRTSAKRVPSWTLVDNSAGPVPSPSEADGEPEEVTFVPYGSTHLRVGEVPQA